MGMRELLILLLGLAIVAVILRGLYVAIQARRGQIRLAIDKNIPRDVDLEALEMAELPSGGARVISRSAVPEDSLEQPEEDPVELANERAGSIDLGRGDEAVPVLMESVQVGSANDPIEDIEQEESEQGYQDEFEEQDDTVEAIAEVEEDWSDAPYADESTDTDDVLFDYDVPGTKQANDGMASVMPDYPDDEPVSAHADRPDYPDHESIDEHDDMDHGAEGGDFEYEEPTVAELPEPPATRDAGRIQDSRVEPTLDTSALGEEFDEFSMTAGERIGSDGRKPESAQTSMFSTVGTEPGNAPAKRKTLFSALSGRFKSRFDTLRERQEEEIARDGSLSELDQEPEVTAEPVVEPAEAPRAIPTQQIDLESAIDSEPESESSEDEDFDELEQDEEPEPVLAEHQAQPSSTQKTRVRQQEAGNQSTEVIVLNVMAREGREFRGEDLFHTVIASGLKFGDMQIFHHRFGNGSNGPVIFSLANILNPGTFDLNNMSQFSTIGVSLFMAMPTPINNLDAFEQMLNVAQQLCATLDGELKDDHRNVMTAQTIEHYRQRIRDFELRQLKTAGSRG